MTGPVTYDLAGGVARIAMDDGKVNVMSATMLGALHTAFDRAAQDGAVVVLRGRPNVFSAGFDLNTLRGGTVGDLYAMLRLGGELALKILSFPRPVVGVCEGPAYPMGAFLLLASDWRIGAAGDWTIGLNEVQIGISPPRFAIEVARQRLGPAYLSRTTVTGEMFGPEEARVAGFMDEIVARDGLEPAVEAAVGRMLSAHRASHTEAKQRLRGELIATVRRVIDEDITLAYASEVCARRAA